MTSEDRNTGISRTWLQWRTPQTVKSSHWHGVRHFHSSQRCHLSLLEAPSRRLNVVCLPSKPTTTYFFPLSFSLWDLFSDFRRGFYHYSYSVRVFLIFINFQLRYTPHWEFVNYVANPDSDLCVLCSDCQCVCVWPNIENTSQRRNLIRICDDGEGKVR